MEEVILDFVRGDGAPWWEKEQRPSCSFLYSAAIGLDQGFFNRDTLDRIILCCGRLACTLASSIPGLQPLGANGTLTPRPSTP